MTPDTKATKVSKIRNVDTSLSPQFPTKEHYRKEYVNTLYVPQQLLVNRIKDSFRNKKPVAVCAGQRAGKNVIATALSFEYPQVMVIGQFGKMVDTLHQLRHNYEDMRCLHNHLITTYTAARFFELVYVQAKKFSEETLIILEEPFWWSNREGTPFASEAFFREVANLTPNVLALGSRGPAQFKNTEVWSYATWDLNPNWSREKLQDQFDEDYERATRDFCG